MNPRTYFWMVGASVLALAGQASAQAKQDASGGSSVTEVVITAQKREERAQDIPLSVTVIGADQLQRQQINSVRDLQITAPGLTFGPPGELSPGGGAQVRGIGTVAFSRSASASVGIVVDGIPTGNVNVSNLFDIERVEVLAGPQGTLFGDSVSAGVINIVTKAPSTRSFSGRIAAQFAPDDSLGSHVGNRTLRGAVNIPLSEDAAVRISGYGLTTNGPVHNTVTGADLKDKEGGLRGRLLWRPSEKLTVNLIGDYNTTRTSDDFFVYQGAAPTSMLNRILTTRCGIVASTDNFNNCGTSPTRQIVQNYGLSAQVDYDFDNATLTYLGGYRDQDTKVSVDIDGLPSGTGTLQIFSGPERHPAKYLTQEVHLASTGTRTLDYVVGAFYSHFTGDHLQPGQTTVFGNPLPASFQSTHTIKKEAAIFGQATYHVNDKARVIVGARYNQSKLDDSHVFNDRSVKSINATIDKLVWRLGAQYDISSNLMAYATATKGYKGPQANDLDTVLPATLIRPERPMYYEAGLKSELFDRRLALNLAVFSANIHDYQGQYCPPPSADPTQANPPCQPQNIEGVKTKGLEISAFGRPIEGLTLNAGAIFNRAEYPKGYFASDATYLGGMQLAGAPRFKGTLSGEYSHPLSEKLSGFVAVDAVYTADTRMNATADPNAILRAQWVVGSRVGVRGDGWSLAAYARNLFDEPVPVTLGSGVTQITDPANTTYWRLYRANGRRQVGISLDYNF